MAHSRRLSALLLAMACSSGPSSSRPMPSPAPSGPTPSMDPVRNTPTAEAEVRYPRAGGGVNRYSLTRRDSLTAPMPTGEQQVQLLGRTAFVTLAWIAADTGTRIAATIDSVIADSALGVGQASLDSARGTRWTGLRRPNGELTALSSAGSSSQVGDQVRDELQLLFPVLPLGGARPGALWSGSVTGPARLSAFEASETASTTSQAGAFGPAGGLEIGVIRTRSASGQGTQFGQPIAIRATGTDTLAYRLALDGRVLTVSGVRRTDLVIELPSIGQSVPAHEHSIFQMTLVR